MLLVARLESAEVLRDPQVGFLLGGIVAFVHLLLFGAGPPAAGGGVFVLVAIGPLGLLFLAGPRRGAAHEGAFRRLVLTCPILPAEWFWGRALGLHALTLLYAMLVAPAFALEAHAAGMGARAVASVLAGFAGYAAFVVFVGLAFSAGPGARGPVVLALVAFVLLVSYRFLGLLPALDGQPIAAFLLALIPSIPILLAAGLIPTGAPPWALACALAALVAGAGVLSWERHARTRWARGAWLAGPILAAALVASTLAAPEGARAVVDSSARPGWAGLAWGLSAIPIVVAARRAIASR